MVMRGSGRERIQESLIYFSGISRWDELMEFVPIAGIMEFT
jgi:hypothetical protein